MTVARAMITVEPHDPTVCAYCHNGPRVFECGMCKGTGKPPKPWFAPIIMDHEKRMDKIIRKSIAKIAKDIRAKGRS